MRLSWPEDTSEIARLAVAQFQRTPWPLDMEFPVAHEFVVNQKAGHIGACCGYRRDGNEIRVMHVWAEDGFRGRRAAVELMHGMERSADAESCDLVFTARSWNTGLRNAVEQHGCNPSLGEDAEAVIYRRRAKRWAVA